MTEPTEDGQVYIAGFVADRVEGMPAAWSGDVSKGRTNALIRDVAKRLWRPCPICHPDTVPAEERTDA